MKRLLRLFKPREREVIQETSTSLLLQTLPTEVLLVIVDHMSLEDAACFALCNKSLYQLVRKYINVFDKLHPDDPARSRFLQQLRRDVSPYLIWCGCCPYLHQAPKLPRYGDDKLKCDVVETDERSYFWFNQGFGFGQVQVAAELHRRGDVRALNTYVSDLSAQGKMLLAKSFVFDLAVRVAQDGNVCIRKQDWCIFPNNSKSFRVPGPSYTFYVCAHVPDRQARKTFQKELIEAEVALSELLAKNRKNEGWTSSSLLHCQHCPTDFRIEYGRVSKLLFAVVVTKWMVLGDGTSRTGGQWPLHTLYNDPPTQKYPAGTCFERFEGHADLGKYRAEWTDALSRKWKE